jgi:multidrug resistance efflux pump
MNSHLATDAAALLAAAEQRRLRAGPDADFMACLIDEAFLSGFVSYLHLWELCSPSVPRMIWKRGSGDGDLDHVQRAANGILTQVRSATGESAGASIRGFVTACQVAEGVRLVLECGIPDHGFDQQQLIDLCEVFGDLHRRRLLSALYLNSLRDQELNKFLATLHSDPDPIRIANCVASDPVELLGCNRIAVARRTLSGAWNIVAATAVSQPDPRADATRTLCRLIDVASRNSDATATEEGLQPECSVRPLSVSGQWDTAEWAVVFEWQDAASRNKSEHLILRICQHASLAFQNSGRRAGTSLEFLVSRLRKAVRGRRAVFLATILMAVVAGLSLWKLELRIEVPGRFVPSQRVLVFAPEEGVITDVAVQDGSLVVPGSPLCRLRNEDLEIQLEVLDGEVASARARLAAIESLRSDRSLSQVGLLSAEQAELKERLSSLEAQAEILNRRMERLDLRATMKGRIYGDRLQENLRGRPVQRGQYLFELADPDQGWQLDFRISESDARHVLEAQALSKAGIRVSYALETEPERVAQTTISQISAATDMDEFGRLSTLASAVPDAITVHSPRPGASVIGQIHCGKHSAGYVVFRRLIEAVQRRWWM